MSNQDLKHFSKSALLGFAGAVFHGFLPPEGDLTKELTNKFTLLTQKMIFSKKFTLLTKNGILEKVYTSDPKHDIPEKVYTSDPKHDIFEKVYTSDYCLIFLLYLLQNSFF